MRRTSSREDLCRPEGVKPTLIRAGKHKAEGLPYFPLDEEAHKAIQDDVNEAYDTFIARVASGRGVAESDVRHGFGEGRAVSAKKALASGMVDHVMTLDQVIERLAQRLS